MFVIGCMHAAARTAFLALLLVSMYWFLFSNVVVKKHKQILRGYTVYNTELLRNIQSNSGPRDQEQYNAPNFQCIALFVACSVAPFRVSAPAPRRMRSCFCCWLLASPACLLAAHLLAAHRSLAYLFLGRGMRLVRKASWILHIYQRLLNTNFKKLVIRI